MNEDEILQELADIGEEIQNVTTSTLQDLANQLPQQLISQMVADEKNLSSRSGGLRNSIRANVRDNRLEFGMNFYGYFQIFGVNGVDRKGSFGLPAIIAESFQGKREGSKFSFDTNKNKHPGILPVPSAVKTLENIRELIIEAIAD